MVESALAVVGLMWLNCFRWFLLRPSARLPRSDSERWQCPLRWQQGESALRTWRASKRITWVIAGRRHGAEAPRSSSANYSTLYRNRGMAIRKATTVIPARIDKGSHKSASLPPS
jgi:hypothetical protein